MRTTIYYFSGTGNSLDVARELAGLLDGDVEIVNIAQIHAVQIHVLASDRIGLVFPVYMGTAPLMVREFVRKIKADKERYFFAVATYGGVAGNPLGHLKKWLKEKTIRLSAGFLVKMPRNYIPLYNAISVAKQEDLFARKTERLKQIAPIITRQRRRCLERSFVLFGWLFSEFLTRQCMKNIPKMDKKFHVVKDKCNQCGICRAVCPAENITLSHGIPEWLGRCEQCMACLQWCPKDAINWGWLTRGRKRYQNPHIHVKEMYIHKKL